MGAGDVSTRRLRYFLAVADQGSFSGAAAVLFVSTTAVSEQVRKLEAELGVRLLDRNPRGAEPTEVGREVAARARNLLRVAADLVELTDRHRRRLSGVLRLGFVDLGAGELTPHLVAAFEVRAPGFQVELVHLDYRHQLRAVLSGEVDAGIVRGPLPMEGLASVELAHEPRMAMMAAAHRLAGRRSVTCADLAGELRVTTTGVDEHWRRWWSLDPSPDGTSPPYGPVVRGFDEQLEAAATGLAISIVPQTAAQVYRRGDVAFVPIADAEPSRILLCAPRRDPHPAVATLLATGAVVATLKHIGN